MRLAWGASIIMQSLLCVALWRSARRDWWLAYLVANLGRSLLLWNVEGLTYYWIWTLGYLPLMYLQFRAVLQVANQGWVATGVYVAVASAAWLAALTPNAWPAARHASLMIWQGCAFVCLGVLLSAGKRDGMTIYYVMQAVAASAAQAYTEPGWATTVGLYHESAISVLFCGWLLYMQRGSLTHAAR